jgi:hypothetical protein
MEDAREELLAKMDALLEQLQIQMITVKVIGEEIENVTKKLEILQLEIDFE